MNKSIKLIASLFSCILLLGSCSDDDNNYEVTEEWKAYQQSLVTKVMLEEDESGERVYTAVKSESGMGYIYYRTSDYITNNQEGNFDEDGPTIFAETKAEVNRPVYDTDVVRVRYEGWYYNEDNTKVVFDSTEKGANNAQSKGTQFGVSDVVDGFKTLLQNMKVGDEFLVCMPYQLAYGAYGHYDSYYGTMIIPGYTTLFFDVKLLENVTATEEAQKE